MKEKIFWISIVVIILSYIGNYLYFQSKQLDAPLFLEHYYELTLNHEDETMLTFYYVTNKSDSSSIDHVQIDGIEAYASSNMDFMWGSQEPQFEQEYTHHYLKALNVAFPMDFEGEGPLSFSEMEVQFSNGKTLLADIGEVILHKDTEYANVLETHISSSSNQHREEKSMVALEPVNIEEIEIPFKEELSDDIFIKVDLEQDKLSELEKLKTGANPPKWFDEDREKEWDDLPGVTPNDDLLPFALEQKEWVRFFIQFNPARYSFFQFSIKLNGKTESGDEFVRELPIIDHPELNQKAINEIIEEKRLVRANEN
ncbi:hypothetical protein [Ferdinandcohnia sp. SAFN-114]|uniref:hypothetical protein n=1 Tax=Ferdinandcohnia sp. SAFN-114 TaxID=3387275 RepID=UPI003F7F0D25